MHLFKIFILQELVNYTIETPYISLKCKIFSVMVALAHSVAVDKFDLSAGKFYLFNIFFRKLKLNKLSLFVSDLISNKQYFHINT